MIQLHLLELRERKYYTKPKTVRRKAKLHQLENNRKKLFLVRPMVIQNLDFYTKKKKKKVDKRKPQQKKSIENNSFKL